MPILILGKRDPREGARRGGWLGRREGANRSVARCHLRIRARPRTTPDAPYRPAAQLSLGLASDAVPPDIEPAVRARSGYIASGGRARVAPQAGARSQGQAREIRNGGPLPGSDSPEGARRGGWLGRREGANR